MKDAYLFLFILISFATSCSKPADQAEEYYNLGKYDLAFKMANQAYSKDRTDAKAAVILWKSQVATRNCGSQKVVENAYSAIRETVAKWDESIIPSLKEALSDRKGCVRLFAIYALGDLPFDQAAKLIAEVLRGGGTEAEEPGMISRDVLIGESAVVLGKRVYTEVYDYLVEMTGSESGLLRAKSAEALGYMNDMRAVDILKELLRDEYESGGKRIVAESARRSLKLLTGEEYTIE
ncbi:MAG: HEAT repeat domain-containing protein [Candidatus Glassbacteria bacterium]